MRESKFEKTEVEVMRLVSLHRVSPLHDAQSDDIDEVDEVDPEDRHSGRDLATCDDSECRDEKREYDRPRVTHDAESSDVESRDEECDRYEDREKDEDELAIFLTCFGRIRHIELQCETSEYEKCDEGKSSRQSWYTIRKIHTIEHEYIPCDRDEEWDIVDCVETSCE